jgi:hypothetical protein
VGAFTFDGTENRMRWDRRKAGFMEVWYATLNHAPTGVGVWLRYTITAPSDGEPYCELWGVLFDPESKRNISAKKTFAIDRLGPPNGRDDGALVRIADAWLSETHLEGALDVDGESLEWSLDMEPAQKCFQHIPARLRRRAEKKLSTVCSPNLSVPFTGTVKVAGELYEFESELGCQSHRWGVRNSESWAWVHCSRFDGAKDAVLEGVAARASIGGPLPPMTSTFLYLSYEGEDLAFNELKWALRARSRYEMPTWAFTARNDEWKIAGAGRATPERLVQVTYTDPDGSHRYCANSEIADVGVEIYRRDSGGWVHHASLTSIRGAHLEFGRRKPFAELPVAL